MATMQYNIYHHAQGCRHSETEPSFLCDKPGRRNLSDRDGSGREAGGREGEERLGEGGRLGGRRETE